MSESATKKLEHNDDLDETAGLPALSLSANDSNHGEKRIVGLHNVICITTRHNKTPLM